MPPLHPAYLNDCLLPLGVVLDPATNTSYSSCWFFEPSNHPWWFIADITGADTHRAAPFLLAFALASALALSLDLLSGRAIQPKPKRS